MTQRAARRDFPSEHDPTGGARATSLYNKVMADEITHRRTLTAHTATQCAAVQNLHAHVATPRQGVLALRYTLHADMSRIRVVLEGTASPGRTDGLWKHTCFEAFIRPDDSPEYYELNFSAAKQWAAYRFDAYREGMLPVELPRAPEVTVRYTARDLELDALVSLPFAYTGHSIPRPRLALSAVVEEDSGRLCYWSARHPEGKPDFHHPDSYVIEL
jgi:hypothetical protein